MIRFKGSSDWNQGLKTEITNCVMRVIEMCDWNQANKIKSKENLSRYDSNQAIYDSNHDYMKIFPKFPTPLIRMIEVCDSSHTSKISIFAKLKVYLRF